MDRQALLGASVAALIALAVWWNGVLYLHGTLADVLPDGRFETVALLYPDVFYPGVPGMYLTELLYAVDLDATLGGLTIVVGLLGWVVALAACIGVAAVWYASPRGRSPATTAAATVIAMYVGFAAIEVAASALL